MPYTLIFVAMVALFLVATFIAVMSRYHRCPSNKILVKYGNVGRDRAALPMSRTSRCISIRSANGRLPRQ